MMSSFKYNDDHYCPICYKHYDDDIKGSEMMEHIKRCYFKRKIRENLKKLDNAKKKKKIQSMSDTIDAVEQEINDYWEYLLECDQSFLL